jgi:uncharacterized SAM-binding protein YcdF (DUF218 family)
MCLVVAVPLIADVLFLMTLGVFSLGVTLPLAIACALLFLALRWNAVHAWLDAARFRRRVWRYGWGLFFLWLASVAAFWAGLASASSGGHGTGTRPAAAIVVLGSGTPGGKVSPVLAARLDKAYDRAQASPNALVVASGGIDFKESRSEGAIMGDYLRAKGLPPGRIAQEEASTSTEQNLLFSRALLQERGIEVQRMPIEVVTSDFHTLRARWIARRADYADVRTVGATTPLYVRYNAWLREYFAVISGFLLREY